MKFIIAKNMPEEIISNLSKIGEVFFATLLNIKDNAVAYHPDMQIHFAEKDYAFCPEEVYDYYKSTLPDWVRLEKGVSSIGITYPGNCAYNVARVGNNIICNKKISDRKIIDYYTEAGFNIIDVKQGYTKCNVAPVGKNMLITEDAGIRKAVSDAGLDCIYIPVGDVALDGFDYGFIGGATGYADNTLLLCGKASSTLEKSLTENHIEYTELSDRNLYDYGSIISFG